MLFSSAQPPRWACSLPWVILPSSSWRAAESFWHSISWTTTWGCSTDTAASLEAASQALFCSSSECWISTLRGSCGKFGEVVHVVQQKIWRTTDFGVYFYMLSINRQITEEHNFDPYPCDRFCWTQHVFFFVFNCITRLKVCNSFPCGFKIFLKVAGFPLREALIWYCLLIRLFLLLLWADPLHFFLFASSNGPKTEPLTYDLASRVLSHFKSVSRQCQGHSVCVFWIRTDFLDLFRIHSDYSAFALLESFCLYLLSSWKPTLSEPTYKGKNNLKKIGKKQENANIGEKLVVRNKSESKFLELRGAAFWMKLPLLLGSSLKSKDE